MQEIHNVVLLMLASVLCTLPANGVAAQVRSEPENCTYELTVWNVNEKRSVNARSVIHSYADLSSDEIDPATGCTVCSEDQETIEIRPLLTITVCRKLAHKVSGVLAALSQHGADIRSVVGYHVIKSRGPVDGNGNRTGFSNHSFGTAIDINPDQNGLYDDCVSFGPHCRLIRGGAWRPGTPGTLDKNSDVVKMFKRAGFLWGGEIAGKQKDFMHFSQTGY